MALAQRRWAAELLHFWFHRLTPRQWFGRSDAVDSALHRRFARDLDMLSRQPARTFLRDRRTARAAVLLFDQAPRNLFRASPRAFAHDHLARAICKGALAKGWHRRLDKRGRQFLLLPLMHSESRTDQALSMRHFTALNDPTITRFARDHAAIVRRFGRFPHRNTVLGRTSSAAEARAVAQGHAW